MDESNTNTSRRKSAMAAPPVSAPDGSYENTHGATVTIPALADSVNDVSHYLQFVFNTLHEQADALALSCDKEERMRISDNLVVLLHCGERYLGDIKDICSDAKKGGKQ